jgi:hypothetical protein
LPSSQCPPKLIFFIGLVAAKLAGDLFQAHTGRMQVAGKNSSPSPRPSPRLAGRGRQKQDKLYPTGGLLQIRQFVPCQLNQRFDRRGIKLKFTARR